MVANALPGGQLTLSQGTFLVSYSIAGRPRLSCHSAGIPEDLWTVLCNTQKSKYTAGWEVVASYTCLVLCASAFVDFLSVLATLPSTMLK